MPAIQQLHQHAKELHVQFVRARDAYRAAARRYLIAELLKVLSEMPQVVALELNVQYEYDDEGGYFRCLDGSAVHAEGTAEEEHLEYWTDGLDVDAAVLLELFEIEDLGEGSLTREQLYTLAAQESIPDPAAVDVAIAQNRDQADEATINDSRNAGQ